MLLKNDQKLKGYGQYFQGTQKNKGNEKEEDHNHEIVFEIRKEK